ncbi:MAG: hypothetical protein ACRDZN_06625 [Acidimicrobiales bacterium]
MAEVISGLSDDDIATEWRHERASDTATDDDATDPKEDVDGTDGTDDADGVDPDTGPADSDADESDS